MASIFTTDHRWHSYVHEPATPLLAQVGTIDVHTSGWCIQDPDTFWPGSGDLLFGSFIGRYPMLRAFWAGVQDAKKNRVSMGWRAPGNWNRTIGATRKSGKEQYLTFWNDSPLALAGSYAHLVILHRSALQPTTNTPFFHLSMDNQEPDLHHFYLQLDRVLTLPIIPAWSEALWQLGLERKAIKPMAAHNCKGWWVEPYENVWAEITTQLHTGDPRARARVETVGATPATDADTDLTIDDSILHQEGDDE